MRSVWNRIEAWLAAHAPNILASLQPGATSDEISATEAWLGITFPESVKDSYRIHNGQVSESPRLIEYWELLSLEQIQFEWSAWNDLLDDSAFANSRSRPDGPIMNDWWNPKWIPLTYNGSGDHHCLDLSPAPGGDMGQIIMMWHDDAMRNVVARSFKAWLEAFADDLEADQYVYSAEYGQLMKRDQV